MEKPPKKCASLNFCQHPLLTLSKFFNPLFDDIKCLIKPNVQVYGASVTHSAYKKHNLSRKHAAYNASIRFKNQSRTEQSKINCIAGKRPGTVDECWDGCSLQSTKLAWEIDRLQKMIANIRQLSENCESAILRERSSFIGGSGSQKNLVKDKNKKVQASIQSNRKLVSSKTTETPNLPAVKNSSVSYGIVTFPSSSSSENQYNSPSRNNQSASAVKQSESKMLRSSSKFHGKQPSSRMLFSDGSVISKKQKKDLSNAAVVASKQSQGRKNNKSVQELLTKPSTQEQIKSEHRGNGDIKTVKSRTCPCVGHGTCYHNYISLRGRGTSKDDKLLAYLSNELERQKDELREVKEILQEINKKKFGLKNMFSPTKDNFCNTIDGENRTPTKSKCEITQHTKAPLNSKIVQCKETGVGRSEADDLPIQNAGKEITHIM